ncbi:MAG: energy transducer TonB [Desulfococcaceae bacterium]
MYEDISSFRGTEIRSRVYYITYTASALIHVLFFAAFVFTPGFSGQHYQMPQSISVSLISLPGPPELSGLAGSPKDKNAPDTESEPETPAVKEEAEAEKPREQEEPEPAPEPVPEPEPEPAEPPPVPIQPVTEPKETVVIPDAPEKKEKPDVKPEKSDAPKIPKEQIVQTKPPKKKNPQAQKPKDVQKDVVKPSEAKQQAESRSESIKDAVDRIRASVGKKSGQKGGGRSGSGDGGNSDSRGRPGGGPGGGGTINDIYKAQIIYQIEQNWAFSPSLAGGRRDLETVLVIRILPDGHIDEIEFERRSGNNYLDESAYRAVVKSNPLPPLPRGYSEYMQGLVFTPSGLN